MDTYSSLKQLLSNYDIGTIHTIKDSSHGYTNINYQVMTQTGNYFLRNYQYKDQKAISYELLLMTHLQQHQFPTAYPIPRNDGQYMTLSEQGNLVLYEFIEGKQPPISLENITQIAHLIGQLHLLPKHPQLHRPNELGLPACLHLIQQFPDAPFQLPELFEKFTKHTHWLQSFLSQELPTGLIHGDAFPDNTILSPTGQLFLIDFEETATDALLIDVAMTINGFCFIDNLFQPELSHHFTKAYQQIRPLTPLETELLPYYILWTAHIMLAWHLEFDLIYKGKPRQHKRALELMERITKGIARLT